MCSFKFQLLGGDGRKGYEPGKPYDAIHVGAAATELPPAVRTKEIQTKRPLYRYGGHLEIHCSQNGIMRCLAGKRMLWV